MKKLNRDFIEIDGGAIVYHICRFCETKLTRSNKEHAVFEMSDGAKYRFNLCAQCLKTRKFDSHSERMRIWASDLYQFKKLGVDDATLRRIAQSKPVRKL